MFSKKDLRRLLIPLIIEQILAVLVGMADVVMVSAVGEMCIRDRPDGDGFSLMQQMRAISPLPVVFLTARGEDEDRLIGLGMGADDYIVKPFLPKELTLRITAILRRVYVPIRQEPVSYTHLDAAL